MLVTKKKHSNKGKTYSHADTRNLKFNLLTKYMVQGIFFNWNNCHGYEGIMQTRAHVCMCCCESSARQNPEEMEKGIKKS